MSEATLLPARVIHFPAQNPIGQLYRVDMTEEGYKTSKPFAPAFGTVHVPEGVYLRLKLNRKTMMENMQVVSTIDPDAIQALDFRYSHIDDEKLQYIRHLHGLQALVLNDTNITNNGLRHLQSLTNLKHLDLVSTLINDDGLIHLRHLMHLESLRLENLTGEGLRYLEAAPIRYLQLWSCPLQTRHVQRLNRFSQLEYLYLSFCNFQIDGQNTTFENHPALKHVVFSKTKVGETTLRKCGALPNLQMLTFYYLSLSKQFIKVIAEFSALQSLEFTTCSFPEADALEPLTRLPNLRSFSLLSEDFALEDANFLRELPLSKLFIDLPNIASRHLEVFLKMPLVDLELRGIDIEAPTGKFAHPELLQKLALTFRNRAKRLEFLDALSDLRRLELYTTDKLIDCDFLRHMPSLECLAVATDSLDDTALEALAQATQLHSLEISYSSGITDRGLQAIANLPKLESLLLEKVGVNGEGLIGFKALRSLTLHDVLLTEAGMACIAALTDLEVLDISDCTVEKDNLEKIAGLTQLLELRLARTNANTAIMPHLAKLKRLYSLDIEDTVIDARAISHLTSLHQLSRISRNDSILHQQARDILDQMPNLNHYPVPRKVGDDLPF